MKFYLVQKKFMNFSVMNLILLVILLYYIANKSIDLIHSLYIKETEVQFLLKYRFIDLNLFISVIVVSPNSKRVPSLLDAWGYEFSNKSANTLKIFTPFIEQTNSTYWIYVNVEDKNAASFRKIFYCNFASARYFYQNTTFKWYLRTTYDCFIHLPNLYSFIHKLNSQYNPMKDIVFKGDHIGDFIHGGPGWIMSRAAVYEYLKMEDEMKIEYNKSWHGDDVNIMLFPKKLNLTFQDVYVPEFAGWPVKDSSYSSLIQSNFNYSNISTICQRKFQPTKVNSIVIWHNGRAYDYVNTIGKKIIDEAPDFVGLHFFRHLGGEFCRLEKNKINNSII